MPRTWRSEPNLPRELAKEPARAQAFIAELFQTIPVTRAGMATVTLKFQQIMSLVGAQNAGGSGGRITRLSANR